MAGPRISAECDACLEMACCAPILACTADAECDQVLRCIGACSDPDVCPGRCFGNGNPPVLFDAVFQCVFGDCLNVCTTIN